MPWGWAAVLVGPRPCLLGLPTIPSRVGIFFFLFFQMDLIVCRIKSNRVNDILVFNLSHFYYLQFKFLLFIIHILNF